ncbi:FecR family protein [Caulobacter sp. KR2-114]|uniref:FecR family protein n=1 Tax=Caulobacter sp. KR2-114 TaxID=3400912 RepID=UPI003C07479F
MPNSVRNEAAARRLVEASAWRSRLTELGVESSEGFEAWISADPANTAAWDRVQAGWSAVGEAAASPELMAARRDALNRARRQSRRRKGRGLVWAAAAAACLVLAAGAGGGLLVATGRVAVPRTYETARGERRVVTLADGSRISLDSGSKVVVRLSRDARRLQLFSGQARFDVAHDVTRPFSVRAREQTVVATGTAFNIDLAGPRVLVTLIEGRVTVLGVRPARNAAPMTRGPGASPTGSVVLTPGQELVSEPQAPSRIEVASLDRVTAWQAGQLIFEDEPLASVAQRISRYASAPVTVDPSAASLRISGVFNAGDVGSFVDTVERYLPVEATEDPDGKVVIRRKK